MRSMSSIASETAHTNDGRERRTNLWLRGLVAICLIALFALALWMCLHTLDLPFDRDSYDEGVYWQTLRAMSAGYHLYSPTFYSQPPIFLLSIYPIYALFGHTIWSARLGVVVIALLGLVGAFLLGRALRGPLAGLIGLALLMLSPLYLAAAQTLQAEATQVAFSMVAVGFAYLWWKRSAGWQGLCYATLCTLTLALSIFSKLFGAATLVPIGLLALAQCWRIIRTMQPAQHIQRQQGQGFAPIISLLLGAAVFLIATLLILLPFAATLPSFWSEVVTFHTAAKTVSTTIGNRQLIQTFLLHNVITYTALYGTFVALWRRDWRVVPLLAWLLTLLYLLSQQAPLFPHHFVILVPALVGLSIMGFGPFKGSLKSFSRVTYATSLICLLLVLATLFMDVQGDRAHYLNMRTQAGTTQTSLKVAHDLQEATQPGQFVITDAQFIAGLAQRSTPPELVDTSNVRISTKFVTTQQVIQLASQPRVRAILFYTGRLQNLTGLHNWVSQHFQRTHTYESGQELWVKM